MNKKFNYSEIINNPKIIGVNRLPCHAYFLPFDSTTNALTFERGNSPYYALLNGKWDFYYAISPLNVPDNIESAKFDDVQWNKIDVPGNWQLYGYDNPQYINLDYPIPLDPPNVPNMNPVGVYKRSFYISEEWSNRRTHIQFEGVDTAFYLYVNGEEVGYSQGAHLHSEFDITDYIQQGENLLVVKVFKWADSTYMEDQDKWRMSGIIRDVSLLSYPNVRVNDIDINTSFDENYKNGILNIKATIQNQTINDVKNAHIRFKLIDALHNEITCSKMHISAIPTGNMVEYKIGILVEEPLKWSAETPNLYSLTYELVNGDEQILDVSAVRVGFRTIKIEKGLFLLNGKPIRLKGVNRHEVHPDLGNCVSIKSMVKDVVLMKQHNINTVRTSHYQNDTRFLELCNIYGLYIIDEADQENHGMYPLPEEEMINNNPEWKEAFVDRAANMVKRDKNYACVIMWSLGNESFFGENHKHMIKYIKKADTSNRPIHYEQAGEREGVDVVSKMYPTFEEIERQGKLDDPRPFFLCEYSHANGNGSGCLKEHWDLIYQYPRLLGGCVWQWVDHGLRKYDGNGNMYFGYGGDFGEKNHNGTFNCGGFVGPDRDIHPDLLEYKKVLEPIKTEILVSDIIAIKIKNNFTFLSTDFLNVFWEIKMNGQPVDGGRLDVPILKPDEEVNITVPYKIPSAKPSDEYFLNIYYKLAKPSLWAPIGYEITHQQFNITGTHSVLPQKLITNNKSKLIIDENKVELIIKSVNFTVAFDKISGIISDFVYAGNHLLNKGPRPNFWRPLTETDRSKNEKTWRKIRLDELTQRVNHISYKKISDECIEVKTSLVMTAPSSLPLFNVEMSYLIYSSGDIILSTHYIPLQKGMDHIAKIGLQMELTSGFVDFAWYGNGPHNSYIDKCSSVLIDEYRSAVDEQFYDYIVPQDQGNKSNCRWAALLNVRGIGLMSVAFGDMNVSAYHYTDEQICNAKHPVELKRGDFTTFNLDYAQSGIGTDSIGPITPEKFRLFAKDTVFTIRLKPFDERLHSLAGLYGSMFE
jgi:beta-galactosidase/beta-glucuronidase